MKAQIVAWKSTSAIATSLASETLLVSIKSATMSAFVLADLVSPFKILQFVIAFDVSYVLVSCICAFSFLLLGGKNCSVELIGCRTVTCANLGTCVPFVEEDEVTHGFKCLCLPGYHGIKCEVW